MDKEGKMKVLTVSIDVSDLTPQQIEDLQVAMEVQSEDYEGAVILNSGVSDLDVEEIMDTPDDNLH